MTRFDQDWVDALAGAGGGIDELTEPMRLLFVVTDTSDGKAAFFLDLESDTAAGTAGRLPRGEKANITVTAKESALEALWSGNRSYDAAFMSGDLKVEGAYERWLDVLTPAFGQSPWAHAWSAA